MKQHHHQHSGSGEHATGHHKKSHGRQLHKDWRTWVAIILMLGAMAIYVLTLDDSTVPRVQPESGSQLPTPAPSQP